MNEDDQRCRRIRSTCFSHPLTACGLNLWMLRLLYDGITQSQTAACSMLLQGFPSAFYKMSGLWRLKTPGRARGCELGSGGMRRRAMHEAVGGFVYGHECLSDGVWGLGDERMSLCSINVINREFVSSLAVTLYFAFFVCHMSCAFCGDMLIICNTIRAWQGL